MNGSFDAFRGQLTSHIKGPGDGPLLCYFFRLVALLPSSAMVLVLLRFVICVFAFAGQISANHIKRHHHHFPSRSQCRPRFHSPDDGHSAVVPSSTRTVSTAHATDAYPSASSARTSPSTLRTTTVEGQTSAALSQSVVTPKISASQISPPPLTTEAAPQSLTAIYIPNNIKAGIAGGDAYSYMESHIGWWYDWTPNPSKPGSPIAIPMLWGDGTVDAQDASRLKAFEKLVQNPHVAPRFVLGYEEPDCPSGSGSADMSVAGGVAKWEELIAPFKNRGTKLGSPSMCKQADETWLAQFEQEIKTPWDFTAVHINKNNLAGVQKDIEHYMKYGKPIWVTEFACVDDAREFEPCTDQGEINTFINDVVDYFERTGEVYAYAYSNGLGLGNVWPLMKGNSLSESGKAYLAAISKYH